MSHSGVTVPVSLKTRGMTTNLYAKIDTGADYCFFDRGYADTLSIDLERIPLQSFKTVNGKFRAYGHELTLHVLGINMDATVYFYEDSSWTRNVLGRNGWLNRVRLGVIDHDSLIYLNAYDD
jgi:hypothetical protein